MFFRKCFLFLMCASVATLLHASTYTADPYPFANQQDEARFHALTQEIRCVVCKNQSIADSGAPLANDLRQKIYGMVLNHQSNETIKNYLVKRYGDFILMKPRFNTKTAILWMFPLIAIFSLGVILSWFFRRKELSS